MPNPKLGTVTQDIATAVRAAKAGAVKFKVDKKGYIRAGIGKLSFTDEALLENIRAFMLALVEIKPENFKSKYLTGAHLSSTMGPSVPVLVQTVDPTNARFMLNVEINNARR
jgi:large subunit ribosomal protein L1